MTPGQTSASRSRSTYDHRLRRIYVASRDESFLREFGVPRSTAHSWLARGCPEIVSFEDDPSRVEHLEIEARRWKRKYFKLHAVLRLLLAVIAVRDVRLDPERLPKGPEKLRLLHAIEAAAEQLGLKKALKVLRLAPSTYHRWKTSHRLCGLDGLVDRSSCPRSSPLQICARELRRIKGMVIDPALRHMPLTTLAMHAKRIGAVFASPATWTRFVRQMGWRRPRTRVHPQKPKVGVRAVRPNQIWHVDVSVIRLLDGTKAFLQAIIDNFSRRILAYRVDSSLKPQATAGLLRDAALHLPANRKYAPPQLLIDSGVENLNAAVDQQLDRSTIQRIIAQVDIVQSNSMIEAFWRSLKHNWLFLNALDSVESLEKLTAFYVQQHNFVMPPSTFVNCPLRRGRTPDEIFQRRALDIHDQLRTRHNQARRDRIADNQQRSCARCHNTTWSQIVKHIIGVAIASPESQMS